MSAQIIELPRPDSRVIDVVRNALVRGMHLIHDGRRIVVSPIVPPGWYEIAIKVKPSAPLKEAA